jgi:hypothetical protein
MHHREDELRSADRHSTSLGALGRPAYMDAIDLRDLRPPSRCLTTAF